MAKIVGIFAHPDDEAMGPAGTLAKLAKTNEVHLICATDGDHQEMHLKNVRNTELEASAKILGIRQVFFLEFADGSLSNGNYHQLADKIRLTLDGIRPETAIVFHPLGVSGHLDHVAVTSVVNFLFPKLDYLQKIMYFSMRDVERAKIGDYFVHMPEGLSRSQADLVENISEVWEQKKSAISCHKSQANDVNMILSILSDLPKEEYFLLKTK